MDEYILVNFVLGTHGSDTHFFPTFGMSTKMIGPLTGRNTQRDPKQRPK